MGQASERTGIRKIRVFNVTENKAGKRGMTKEQTNKTGGKVITGTEGGKRGAMH
jgi:hypothetical protein